jgi:drug/metabolite transporter (DMT)-like permease
VTTAQKTIQIENISSTELVTKVNYKSEKFIYGILFLFSMFAGATWPAGKIVAQNLSPIGAAFYRYSVALPIFVTISLLNRKTHSDSFWNGKNNDETLNLHFRLALLGFLGVTLYTTLFLEGVKRTSASDATLIFAMTPTLTVLIANFVIPDDKISKNKVLGLIFAISGVGVIFLQSPNTDVPNRMLGNLLILVSALVMAVHTVFSKPIFKNINVIDFSTWIMFYGWIFLLIPTLIQNPEYMVFSFILDIKLKVAISIIYLALFIVYATVVFAYGVKRIGPTRTAIFMNLIPVFGVLSSILILSEAFSLWYLPAFSLIMFGVYQVNKQYE